MTNGFSPADKRPVLVTGGAGFIGCWPFNSREAKMARTPV